MIFNPSRWSSSEWIQTEVSVPPIEERETDMPPKLTPDGQKADEGWTVVYRTSITQTSAESMSMAVVEAIEEVTEKTVTEIGPIQTVFDSEALDNLFAANPGKRGSGQFPGFASFEFEGFLLTVYGTGEIVIRS